MNRWTSAIRRLLKTPGFAALAAGSIAIGIALGASRGDLRRLVLGQGLRLAIAALVIGLPLRSQQRSPPRCALLFGTSPFDPLVYAAATVVLAGVVLVAFWLPARRAGRVDPLIVLRTI